MTLIELEAKKAELVRSILNYVDSEDVLDELSEVLQRKIAIPAIPSNDDINVRANRAITAFHNGETHRFISHDELKKRHLA